MYHETTTAISNVATLLEEDLKYTWYSLNVKLIESSEDLLLFAFTYKMDDNRPGSENLCVRNRCFSSDLWLGVVSIVDRQEFIRYIRSAKLVEQWNSDFHSRDVPYMIGNLEIDVEDFLCGNEADSEIEKVSGNLDERDVEEIFEIVRDMNVIIRCDDTDFWTEAMLVEAWEANAA